MTLSTLSSVKLEQENMFQEQSSLILNHPLLVRYILIDNVNFLQSILAVYLDDMAFSAYFISRYLIYFKESSFVCNKSQCFLNLDIDKSIFFFVKY